MKSAVQVVQQNMKALDNMVFKVDENGSILRLRCTTLADGSVHLSIGESDSTERNKHVNRAISPERHPRLANITNSELVSLIGDILSMINQVSTVYTQQKTKAMEPFSKILKEVSPETESLREMVVPSEKAA
jgi:hypothetical protein